MTTTTYAGLAVDLNDEGFFTRPEQWTKDIAVELAAAEGLADLTPKHWQVLEFPRSTSSSK